LRRLKDEGVKIQQVNQLDGLEPVPPEVSLLLPGEDPSVLTPLLSSEKNQS